jgi:hypothetical protein
MLIIDQFRVSLFEINWKKNLHGDTEREKNKEKWVREWSKKYNEILFFFLLSFFLFFVVVALFLYVKANIVSFFLYFFVVRYCNGHSYR